MNSFSLEDDDYEILAILETTYKREGYYLGKYDLMNKLGMSYKAVNKSLKRLLLAKRITLETRKNRSIKVL